MLSASFGTAMAFNKRLILQENAESDALRTGFRRKPDSVPMIADSR
jgi:hypothetical protein